MNTLDEIVADAVDVVQRARDLGFNEGVAAADAGPLVDQIRAEVVDLQKKVAELERSASNGALAYARLTSACQTLQSELDEAEKEAAFQRTKRVELQKAEGIARAEIDYLKKERDDAQAAAKEWHEKAYRATRERDDALARAEVTCAARTAEATLAKAKAIAEEWRGGGKNAWSAMAEIGVALGVLKKDEA